MDSFSPSAPARVRALVLPAGKIKRAQFYSFLEQLTPHCEVRLGDVTADPRPDRGVFSPLGFPDGYVLYDFTTSAPSNVQLSLSPFELFREPLLLLAIADSKEYDSSEQLQELADSTTASLEGDYPRMLVRKILFFDSAADLALQDKHTQAIHVQSQSHANSTSMRTIMCDITSLLLAEMTTLAASLKALPSIASPSVSSSNAGSVPWNTTVTPTLSRASSASGERANSPSTNHNHSHRMSMPVLPSNSDMSDSRPESPDNGRSTPPARTFDELMNGGNSTGSGQKATPTNSRDTSRDRVSLSGFGPGSLDEKKRNQGRSRVSIVISSLYMLAGRWGDALNELAEAATRARSFSDHIWHAKAMENMLVCLTLLAWAGVPFKIPRVCYPVLERTSSKLAQITSPTSPTPNSTTAADVASARKELADVLPDMANMIVGIYNRAANYTSEYLPQLAFSECIIRLSRTQAGVALGRGSLSDASLSYIVRGTLTEQSDQRHTGASKTRITDMVMKAMPGPADVSGLSAVDEASILAGIASVLSALGLQRKKAMLLREYIHVLIQALEEAKRSGAAEAGIHPSTNGFSQTLAPAASRPNSSEGLGDFLNLLCRVYGIPESRWLRSVGSDTLRVDGANEHATHPSPLPDELVGNFILRSFGSVNLKSDVLRTCIQLCEALPDPHGALYWVTALLRTAGPGTAPSSESSDVLVTLSREEQLVLSSTILKTVTDAKAMGLHSIDAEYWDEFLVRGVILIDASTSLALHLHKKSDLLATEPKQVAKKGPFIHNPFLEKPKNTSVQNLLVANDDREFVVSLQNPYDFEIYVEAISFMAGGHRFGRASNLLLRPYRTQSFSVTGMISTLGQYDLETCIVKIQGCRERAFPIFADAWRPEYDPKIKSIGLLKAHSETTRPESDASESTPGKAFPKPTTVPLTVIPPQPALDITSVSLPQSSAMLLEGESITFKAVVKNTSKSVATDFVHISFSDSTTAAIQDAISKKNLSSAELFELEYQLSHHPAIKLVGDNPSKIGPDECCELTFELLGKPGLTQVMIMLDYANLQTPHTDNQNLFYTRQVTLSLSVTVNASTQLQKLDVLPVSNETVLPRASSNTRDDHYLLMLDFRNAWPSPLEIRVENVENSEPDSSNHMRALFRNHEIVQPGHIARLILLLPKIYINNPHARIRSANERQFVVSANAASPETERVTRELFWYREALLKSLRATWRQEGSSKHGIIDLRSVLRLTPRMMDAVRLDDLDIQMTIHQKGTEQQASQNVFNVKVDDYAILETRITNRSQSTIYPILRLQPSLSHQPPELALDLSKRLAWGGLLQTIMRPITPGETATAKLAICALCSGQYQFGATVEEIKRSPAAKEATSEEAIPDPIAGSMGRRSWIASKPCMIIATEHS